MSYNRDIIKMTPRHYKILDYAIAGLKPSQIASKLGMTASVIGTIINSPSFQHQFSIRRTLEEENQTTRNTDIIDETVQLLQSNTKAAAQKLIDGLSATDEKIVIKSATEILDRGGYPKEQKVSSDADNRTQIIINTAQLSTIRESLNMDMPAENPELEKCGAALETGTTDLPPVSQD